LRAVEGADAGEDGGLDRAVFVGGGFEEWPVVGADSEDDLPLEASVALVRWMHA
jgi:hypothetical protein